MKGYGMGAIIIGATGAPGGTPVVCRAAGAARVAPGVMGSATVQGAGTMLGRLTSRLVSNRDTVALGMAPSGGAVMVPGGSVSMTRMVVAGDTRTVGGG